MTKEQLIEQIVSMERYILQEDAQARVLNTYLAYLRLKPAELMA
jgi:hypothetical protein